MERIEVITGVQRRRRYSAQEKAFMVAECELRIPASVTGHSGHRDRFAHGHRAGVGFVL